MTDQISIKKYLLFFVNFGRSFYCFKSTSFRKLHYRLIKKCVIIFVVFVFLFTLAQNFIFFGPASWRSYKIGVVGNWLVGNAVFSETTLRIFLIFCKKLGTIKVEKWRSRIFEKTSWFGDIRGRVSKLAQN